MEYMLMSDDSVRCFPNQPTADVVAALLKLHGGVAFYWGHKDGWSQLLVGETMGTICWDVPDVVKLAAMLE